MHHLRKYRPYRAALTALFIGVVAHSPALSQSFSNNDFLTFGTGEWGETPVSTNTGALLVNNYNSVFASSNDLVEIGIHGTAGTSIIFDSGDALNTFLSERTFSGQPGPLQVDLLDPATSFTGGLANETAALLLNIDFNNAGLIKGNINEPFGDLVLTGLTGTEAFANGMNLNSLLNESNIALGGGPLPGTLTYSDLVELDANANMSFDAGFASTFAKQNLELPPSTIAAPEMDASSALSGFTLLLGVLVVLRGRASVRHG